MLDYLKYLTEALGMPSFVLIIVAAIFVIVGIILKIIEANKKIKPEAENIKRKIEHRKEVKRSINELPSIKAEHERIGGVCSEDNIFKLKNWCGDVDESVKELKSDVAALRIQSMRESILAFARIVANKDTLISREDFSNIFNTYKDYEAYIAKRGMKNGVVDCAYQIIEEAFEDREERHFFTEYRLLERHKHKE